MDSKRTGPAVRKWRVAILAAIVSVGIASPVYAQGAQQGKPKVYVFPFVKGEGVSEVVFNKVEQYFMTLFQMSTKFQLLTDEEVKEAEAAKQKEAIRKTTKVSEPWLEKADNLLWTGKDLLVKKEFEKAIRTLNQAKDLYEEHYLELRDYDKLVDAYLQLAIAFFQAGYKDNGEELLKDVLVWRPTLVVDRKKYPKEFVDSLESLKNLLEGRKGGVLRVEAAPADGAKVYVDGLLKGTMGGGNSGIDVTGLYRGKHYVQVIKDGFEIWARKVGVPKAGRTTKVVAELAQAKTQDTGTAGEWEGLAFSVYQHATTGDYGMDFSNKAKAFADRVEVPYLLFGFVSKEARGSKLTLFLYKAEWSGLAEVEPVEFDQNLTNLQVNLLFLEANLASALQKFPKNRVVRGTPEVYIKSRELAEKAKAPVVVPTPPVKQPEKPVEPVVKVEPKIEEQPREPEKPVEPVRVTPTVAEKQPVLPSRTDPTPVKKPDEDLGDLSSIFSDTGSGETGGGGGAIVSPGITTRPEDDWGRKDDDDDSITRKWWFWTGIAAGAGLLGGGSYLLYDSLSGSSSSSGFAAQLQWGQ